MGKLELQIRQLEWHIYHEKMQLAQHYHIIRETITSRETIFPALLVSFVLGFLVTQKKSYSMFKILHHFLEQQ